MLNLIYNLSFVMKWTYKISMFLLLLSQTIFFLLAIYHTDSTLYYPGGDLEKIPTVGFSWIWYHLESWMICVVLNLIAIIVFFYGSLEEKMNWKSSDLAKIEIEEDEQRRDVRL